MNATHQPDTTTTTASLPLWRVAEAFMHLLHALFGDPSQIAAKHTLTFAAHQLMASWLRAGEAMMRRLLLIEAAVFAKPNKRPLLRTPRPRTRKLVGFTPEAPEHWRVSFRCMYGPRASRRHAPAPTNETPAVHRKRLSREERWCLEHRPKPRFRSAWPLAERYEALLRVFNAPLAYARRLARRLHATPHRIQEVLRASPHAEHRVDEFTQLNERARAAWRTDSS